MALQLNPSLIKPAPWALEPSRTRLPALWRDALWVCDCRRTPTEWMHGDAGTIVGSVEGVATSRGEALRFFGTGKYVIFPKRIAAINLPLTILAFVNFGSAGTHGHLYTTNQWDATRIEGVAISRFSDFVYVETGLGLGAGSGNRRSTGWPYAGTGWVMLGFEVTVPDHHAGRRLYIDGVDQGAHGAGSGTANSIGIVSNQGSTLGFGDDADFDLGIVAVFDRALTPAEHQAFARDPFGVVAPGTHAAQLWAGDAAGGGAISGVLAADLPATVAGLSGEVSITGDLAAELPMPAAAASGQVTTAGDLAADLPVPSAALSGEVVIAGDLAANLPVPTTTLSAVVSVDATLGASLPVPIAALSAGVTIAGSLAADLPVPTTTLTGTVGDGSGTVTASLTASLPVLTMSAVGQVLPPSPQPPDFDRLVNRPLVQTFGERFAGVQADSGEPFLVDGIFEDEAELVDVGGRVGVIAGAPTLFVRLASWPAGGPREGDRLVRQADGLVYRVVGSRPNGVDATTITLTRQQ